MKVLLVKKLCIHYHGCQCHGVHSYECSSIICNNLVRNSWFSFNSLLINL